MGEAKDLTQRSESLASLATSFSVGSGYTAQSQVSYASNVTGNLGNLVTTPSDLPRKQPSAKVYILFLYTFHL